MISSHSTTNTFSEDSEKVEHQRILEVLNVRNKEEAHKVLTDRGVPVDDEYGRYNLRARVSIFISSLEKVV